MNSSAISYVLTSALGRASWFSRIQGSSEHYNLILEMYVIGNLALIKGMHVYRMLVSKLFEGLVVEL